MQPTKIVYKGHIVQGKEHKISNLIISVRVWVCLLIMIQILRKKGWILNPNDKIVNAILKRVEINNGECPCHNESIDKHCPCSDYRENDMCHCGLYVHKDV